MRKAIDAAVRSEPDAALLLGAGKGAFDFGKGLREPATGPTQIYGLSVLPLNDLVEMAGLEAGHGVVLSQATLPALRHATAHARVH